jgi:uncharacterized protein
VTKDDLTLDDLPLYDLFIRLRDAGFPLGISDYNLLLEVLLETDNTSNRVMLNFLSNPDSIKNLCQTLWIKSTSQRLQFETIFAEFFPELLESVTPNPKKLDIKNKEQAQNLKSTQGNNQANSTLKDNSNKEQDSNQNDKKEGEYFFFTSAFNSEAVEPPIEDLNKEEDSNKVVKAVRTGIPKEWNSFKPSGLKDEYFPITAQQMQQEWYSLRHSTREGQRLELDIAATIEETKRRGKFFHPIQKPRSVKSANLVLLIDQRGSMQPFHVLSRLLVETALKAGCLKSSSCYYFNNYPRNVLYGDPQFITESPIEEVMRYFNPNRTVVLIFSDAGAARGNFVERRVLKTWEFLEKLKQHSKAVSWLNPVPQKNWSGTTAEAILNTKVVQMFVADLYGFRQAIEVLQ